MVIKLETEKLILRKPRRRDFEEIHKIINDINIAKNITAIPYPYSFDKLKNIMKQK